jgi:hypothetical protein
VNLTDDRGRGRIVRPRVITTVADGDAHEALSACRLKRSAKTRRMRVACIAFVLLPAVAALLFAGAVKADPRFHGGRVYVANEGCNGREYRPQKIILACGDGGLWATNLVYHTYGGRTATATVTLHAHNCIPNCALSRFHAFPATITLADVVRCEGTLYYSRIRYHFTYGAPYGGLSSGTAYVEPFGEEGEHICSTILG